jgi:class 3 adenylate cyclase
MAVLREHNSVVREALGAKGGREVKHTGDGIMASFDEIPNALECGLAVQAGFRTRETVAGAAEYQVRVGMAAGEPVDHNDDLFGPTVNLARRICDVATPGEVFVSDAVHEQGVTTGFSFAAAETVTLRGFAKPVTVFRVLGRDTE